MSETIFIFDIDNTLADNSKRFHNLDKQCVSCLADWRDFCSCGGDYRITKTGWRSFRDPDALMADQPFPEAVALVQRLQRNSVRHHYITGRSEELRDVTTAWLKKYFGFSQFDAPRLMMHPGNPEITSVRSKLTNLQALDNEIHGLGGSAAYMIFEDDSAAIKAYSSFGTVFRTPDVWGSVK